jgi:hypothetical protein
MEKEKLKQKGLEMMTDQIGISETHLEILGKLKMLKEDDRVSYIFPINGGFDEYIIQLNNKFNKEDIIKITSEYGLSNPSYISKKKNPFKLVFEYEADAEITLRFIK